MVVEGDAYFSFSNFTLMARGQALAPGLSVMFKCGADRSWDGSGDTRMAAAVACEALDVQLNAGMVHLLLCMCVDASLFPGNAAIYGVELPGQQLV